MSDLTISKTYTSNPFIDYLLYYTKILSFGSVIKDEDEALRNETKQSILHGDALISCIEGNAIFELFNYDAEILSQVGITNESRVKLYTNDRNTIPNIKESIPVTKVVDNTEGVVSGYAYNGKVYQLGEYIKIDNPTEIDDFRDYKVTAKYGGVKAIYDLHKELTEKAATKYISTYKEENNYYRKICGLPDIGDYGIPIMDYEYFDVNGIQEFINNEGKTYIHELSTEQLDYLDQKGVLDQIKADYPKASYLDYVTCGLTPYKVRKAYNYQLLYTPSIDTNAEIVSDKFTRRYEENRLYVMATFYTDAFKLTSSYYSNFIGMMIMIMTITDILSEVHEDIIKRDIFDKRCIQYIFNMYGIPYYNTIPIKYQYRMCKNINSLIRYKSCSQGMLNIVDLFGAENIEIFRYFILRDRKIDKWGNILYNEKELTNSSLNNVLYDESTTMKVTSGNTYTITYPKYNDLTDIPNYLSSGNVLQIWCDNQLLVSGTDYTINDSSLTITKTGLTDKEISLVFYYNKETITPYIDTEHNILINSEQCLILKNVITPSKYVAFKSAYYSDENDVIVCVDGSIVNPSNYTINLSNTTIVLDDTVKPVSDIATVFYIYSKYMQSKFKQIGLIKTSDGVYDLSVSYTPFLNYLKRNNNLFITDTSSNAPVIIPNDKYTIYPEGNGSITYPYLQFKDSNASYSGICANYIYSDSSMYNHIEISTSTETFTATEDFQVSFNLTPPFANYFKLGYKAYPTLRTQTRMLNSDLYDIYNNTLTLRDQSMGLQIGQNLVVTYVYGPDISNITIKQQQITALYDERERNSTFVLGFPIDNYFENNNALIIDVIGNYLFPEDYTINGATLTINNNNKLPYKDDVIYINYVMNDDNEDTLQFTEQTVTPTEENQMVYTVSTPISPFVFTKQSALVFLNSSLLPTSDYTLTSDDKLTLTNSKLKITKDSTITLLYIFNKRYRKSASENVFIEDSNPISLENINNDVSIAVPYPFANFEENDWLVYVTYNDGTLIPSSLYDLTDGYFTFVDPTKNIITSDTKTGIVFHFVYYNNERFVYTDTEEIYDKDIDLKFIGVPIEDEYFNKNIIAKTNELSYDSVTLEDAFWDGVGYDTTDVMHEKVKQQVLAKKFNYERAKYFGLNYVFNIAQMSFNTAYFYNVFFDDVFKENKLTIQVPSIASYKKFNVAYLFCYLNALGYEYNSVDDNIIDTMGKILYINGFNFKVDLDALRKWILDQRREPNNFDTTYIYKTASSTLPKDRTKDVWKFDIKKDTEFKNMEDLIAMFDTKNTKKVSNKDIYNFIVRNIFKSQDHDIYRIWKKLFDSMMTYKQSLDFYKITDNSGETRLASTLTEFLKYKDNELYTDLMEIKGISNTETRNETIINRITDVVYMLEEYLDSSEFSTIFDSLPGVSGDFFLDMLFTVINFFKSYKIVLRAKTDYIIFNVDDPYLNTLKYVDVKDNHTFLYKYEYMPYNYTFESAMATHYYDKIGFTEYIEPKYDIADSINDKYMDYAKEHNLPTTNVITVTVWVPKNQIITIYTSTGETYTTYNSYGILEGHKVSEFTNKDTVSYFYSQLKNDNDKAWFGFKLTGDTSYESSRFMSILDNPLSPYYSMESINGSNKYKLDNVSPTELGDADFITFKLHYGDEIYCYLDSIVGYDKGVLNITYAKAFDDDITVFATDAIPITEFIYLHLYNHTHITLTDQTGKVLTEDESITVNYGTLIFATVTADIGYTKGTVIIDGEDSGKDNASFTALTDVSVTTQPVEAESCTVKIICPTNETIKLFYGDKDITVESDKEVELTIDYNTTYNILVNSSTEYQPGTLNISKNGVFTPLMATNGVITITTTAATVRTFKVTINQTDHQTIHAFYNHNDYTSSFTVPIYAKINITVVADTGYTAGRPIANSYTVTSNLTINANSAIANTYDVKITTLANEYIHFTTPTVDITVEPGTTQTIANVTTGTHYLCELTADYGYDAGELNIVSSGEITSDMIDRTTNSINITCTKATINQFYITISQHPNQTITATYKGTKYTTSFMADYNSSITVVVVGDTDYTPGDLSVTSPFTVTKDTEITVTDTTYKQCTITIVQTAGQTISVYDGTSTNPTIHTETFTTPAHFSYVVSVAPTNDNYIAGTPSVTEINDITSNITVTATAATLRKYTVTIVQKPHYTITVTCNGKDYTSKFEVDTGTAYTYTITHDTGYPDVTIDTIPTSGYIITDLLFNID